MNEEEEELIKGKLEECFSKSLIEIYEQQGENAFRNLAEYLRLPKKDIEERLKELKDLKGGEMKWKQK